jgi:hypothetical protein
VPCSIKGFFDIQEYPSIVTLLLKISVTWSVSLIHCSVVLWRARKPNWHALCRPLSSMCLWTIFSITFSNSLSVVDNRLIGRKFWGNSRSLPGLGKIITFASFQEFGERDSRRQWLNTCKWSSWKVPEAFVWNAINSAGLSQFQRIWSWAPGGARHQDGLTDWPSVVTWLWIWLLFFWNVMSCRGLVLGYAWGELW